MEEERKGCGSVPCLQWGQARLPNVWNVSLVLALILTSCVVCSVDCSQESSAFLPQVQKLGSRPERSGRPYEDKDTHSERSSRTKRQILYFVLNFLGEEGIRNYVKNVKTENIPSLMGSVGTEEILYIVSSLPPEEIMRLLTALPPQDMLTLAKKMSPSQVKQLLGYVPAEGLVNLTDSFNPDQLQELVLLLPAEGIVNLTKSVPPSHAKKLMKSLPPEVIFNMTQSMSPAALVDLMTSLPPDIIVDLTQALSPENMIKLLKSLPPEVLVTLITALPSDAITKLISSFPPGLIESYVDGLTEEELGTMVKSMQADQVSKLLTSVPANHSLDINSLLKPKLISAVMRSVPGDLIANLTRIMSPVKLSTFIAAIPDKTLLLLISSIPTEQMLQLVRFVPPETLTSLISAIPTNTLVTIVQSFPLDAVVNLTVAMAQDTEIISGLLGAFLTPKVVAKFSASLPLETILAIVKNLPDETIGKLAAAVPVKKVFHLVQSLSSDLTPDFLNKLVARIPGSILYKLARSVPPDVIARMSETLTRNQLRKLVRLVTPEMLKLMIVSIPPEVMVNIVTALPEKVLNTVFSVLSPGKISELLAAIPQERFVSLALSFTPDQMVDMMGSLPSGALPNLMTAVPRDTLVAVANSLPVDAVVNVTVALAEDQETMRNIFNSVLLPDLISKFYRIFSQEKVVEILRKLPDVTIANLAASLPVKKVLDVLSSVVSDLQMQSPTDILKEIPTSVLVKVLTAVPAEVVANMSEQLTRNQMRKVIQLISPEMLRLLVTSVPPQLLVNIAKALPEDVVSTVLTVLSPKHFSSLVKAVPIETFKILINAVLSEDTAERFPESILASTRKITKILLSIPPATLTRLAKSIPRDVLVKVIDSLPSQVITAAAALLSGEEGVPLASALPIETTAYAVSIVPPESIVKIVDILPHRTIGAFANLAMNIAPERIQAFFQLVQVGSLKNIVTKMPPRTIEKLASSLSPQAFSKMAQSISPVTVAPIMESFRPRELKRLIRAVNTTTLSNLLNSIPQDVIVNLTQALPAEQIAKLASAIPPEIMSQVVTHMDPSGMVALMKAMPPSVIENILTNLPTALLVNMTRILPPAQMQDLLELLPEEMIGKMISILPKDVLVDLVKTFDPDAMLDMMQKLKPQQLMGILATLPPEVILNITKAQTPEQTMKLLSSLPPDGIVNLTKVIPIDIMLEMMQTIPTEGLIGLIASMPLKDIFTLASQLTPQQMVQMMEQFTADKDLIPNLLASIDMDRIMSVVEAIPPDLIWQVAGAVDVSMVMDLAGRFMPKVQKMLMDKMDQVLLAMGRDSTVTFQQCLADLGVVAHSLVNLSEWAFHFVDASGKPGRGMLEGNIHMIGNFDQCKKINYIISGGARDGDIIAGSYCHVQFEIPLEHLPPIPGDGILPMPEIAIDVCLPDSCRDFDLHHFLKNVRLPLNVTVPRVACQQDQHIVQDPLAISACVFISIIVLVIFLCTAVDCLLLHRCRSVGDNNNEGSKLPHYKNGQPVSSGNQEEDKKVVEKLLTMPMEGKAGDSTEMQELGGSSLHSCNADSVRFRGMADANCAEVLDANLGNKNGICISDEGSCDLRRKNKKDGIMPVFHTMVKIANNSEDTSKQTTDTSLYPSKLERPDERLWLRILRAFSIRCSVSTMLSTTQSADNVHCLHGIRVLTMLWVVFANTVVFGALYFENLLHAANDLISMPAQVILNSSLSQDTFFTISGVLTALSFLRAVKDEFKAQHLIYYYLHRFVRVMPAYVLVLVVCTCLLSHVADGPHWPPPLQQQCQEQWWINLLFINNYFISIEHMCMSWTWFMANLMQFYWIAPLVLVPFAFQKKIIGFVAIGALVAVHITLTIVLEIGVNGDVLRRQSMYFWKIYQQPWCRVAPYALGLGLGFILHQIKFLWSKNKVVVYLGWILAFSLSSILTLITYDENRYLLKDAAGWSLAARTLHETLQRPLWALLVCWVVFACSTGNGGPINTVLSWKGFLPLSRLSYGVYLIHPVVIICDLLAYRVFAYFSIAYVVFRYVGYVVVAYVLALVLSVFTEAPMLAVERTFMSVFRLSSTT